MPSLDEKRRTAFAKQARSDYRTYEVLCGHRDVEECQRLHYIQMSMEKLAKAYLWSDERRGQRPQNFERSHPLIQKVVPQIYRNYCRSLDFSPDRTQMSKVRDFCGQIDKLCPAVDSENRPDNCEYPWMRQLPGGAGQEVIAPADHAFPVSDRIRSYPGVRVLKCVKATLNEILRRDSERSR